MRGCPILDPRGKLARSELTLASRLSGGNAQQARVLLYNNTKLDFCHYPEVFPRLKQLLAAHGIGETVELRETPRGKGTAALGQFAGRLADTGADAAILGLADIGVTPATTILTILLEQAGIPSVLLTAGPGVDLARGTAYYRAGRLCLCPLETYQGSTRAEVRAEVERIFPDLWTFLTQSPAELEDRVRIRFAADARLPAASGYLEFPEPVPEARGPVDALPAITTDGHADAPAAAAEGYPQQGSRAEQGSTPGTAVPDPDASAEPPPSGQGTAPLPAGPSPQDTGAGDRSIRSQKNMMPDAAEGKDKASASTGANEAAPQRRSAAPFAAAERDSTTADSWEVGVVAEPARPATLPAACVFDAADPGTAFSVFTRRCAELHIGDGLPLIPPTEPAVEAMLAWWPGDSEQAVIADGGPAGNDIRVRDIAVNAVMAGCRPAHLPVVVAAFQAMAQPQYNFLQSVTTSHAGGNLVLVSGPIARELGIHSGQGCIGPGFQANATIGRAVNLTIINTTRAIPGVCDLDCLASPAQFTYCFAEAAEHSPWPTVNTERHDPDTTTVFVLKAEPPHDVIEYLSTTAAHLLVTLAGTCTSLGTNNAYIPGNLVLVLTPDHARLLARDGYDKNAIRRYIHEHVRNPADSVRGRGIVPVRPAGFDEQDPIPVTRSPRDVEVVVAGGKGGHSAVILPWALHSEAVAVPLATPSGQHARTIQEFRRG